MELVIVGLVVALLSVIITVFVLKKIYKEKFEIYMNKQKQSKVIEHEAEVLLKDAQIRAKRDYDREFKSAKRDYDEMLSQIEKKEKELNHHLESELKSIKEEKAQIVEKNEKITTIKDGLKRQQKTYEEKISQAIKILENASGLTEDEAKELMLEKVKRGTVELKSHQFSEKI